jgi:hypothetical protein
MIRICAVVVIVAAGFLAGCEKEPQPVPQPETTVETQTPVREPVTKENLDREIDKMQQEIDADAVEQ